jgi:hypothetical protein
VKAEGEEGLIGSKVKMERKPRIEGKVREKGKLRVEEEGRKTQARRRQHI